MLYRSQLEKLITNQIKQNFAKRKFKSEILQTLYDDYNIPESVSSDYVSLRKDLSNCDQFVLYALAVTTCGKDTLKKFFSEKELEHFDGQKFEVKKLQFPLIYKMIQIRDNQWIGKITVKELLDLSNAQFIHYNENTQRTLKRVISDGIEYYKISLNKKAVEEIRDSYHNGSYIPNTLTFNIPIDKTDFDYNSKTCEFSINNMEYLDIIDGYHRYVAAIEESSMNPDFDYEMEIRFVCFQEEDAKKFIFQEDQKTQMTKIDSDSFNQDNYGNKIVTLINDNSGCSLNKKITTNSEQIINAPELSRVINEVYLTKEKLSTSQLIMISRRFVEGINSLVGENTDLLEKRWEFSFIVAAVFCIKKEEYILDKVVSLEEQLKEHEERALVNKKILKPTLARIEELYQSI